MSGRINTWKGVNQLKELFFLNSIIFKNKYLKLTNHRYFMILWLKTHYFSQFITKMGVCCKILSLNDLTPSPIRRTGTHFLQWQRANARANLWWRHSLFTAKPASRYGPVLETRGSKKGLGDAWVSFHPTDVVNLTWQVRFWKKFTLTERRTSSAKHLFTLHTASHADHRLAIPILHVKYRAQFLLGVGWGGMSYWGYVTLSRITH